MVGGFSSGCRLGRVLSVWPALQLVQGLAELWQPLSIPSARAAHAVPFQIFDSREHRHPQEVFFLSRQTLGGRQRGSRGLIAMHSPYEGRLLDSCRCSRYRASEGLRGMVLKLHDGQFPVGCADGKVPGRDWE